MAAHVIGVFAFIAVTSSLCSGSELGGACSFGGEIQYDVTGVEETTEGRKGTRFVGTVTVKGGERTQMRVLTLMLQTEDGQVVANPPGIDLPVLFDQQDKPSLQNLRAKNGDTRYSVTLKKAIINKLPAQAGNVSAIHSQVQDMLDLLEEGKNVITLPNELQIQKIVLVVGNTGAGKSTFVQWIAGTNNTLVAKETSGGDFVIEDMQNKISIDTIQSQTTFPELVLDPVQNVAYYDLPGFSDTRSAANEIATSYFTTSVIEHTKAVKLVFVVNYSSVRKGIDRKDFILLLKHITELVIDINKFQDSVVMVVTKVENKYKKGLLVDDVTIMKGIAEFLNEVKRALLIRIKLENLAANKLIFLKKAVKIINVLLTKDGDIYTKIALFRRPDESGPLSEFNMLEVEKIQTQHILNDQLNYTEIVPADFGRTISESSKNEINYLVEEVERNILFSICEIANNIDDYLHNLISHVRISNGRVNVMAPNEADIQIKKINKQFYSITLGIDTIQKLTVEITNINSIDRIPKLIYNEVISNNLNTSEKILSKILNEGNYLKFLVSSTDTEFNTWISITAWASAFQHSYTELIKSRNDLHDEITQKSKELEDKITADIDDAFERFKHIYYDIEKATPDIEQLHDYLLIPYHKLEYEIEPDRVNTSNFVNDVFLFLSREKVSYPSYLSEFVSNHEQHLMRLNNSMTNIKQYLHESVRWYKFLNILSILLYRDDKTDLMCNNLATNLTHLETNQLVSDTVVTDILRLCYSGDYDEGLFMDISNITLNKPKLWHLERLLELTLGNPSHTCGENGTMRITGLDIKMSDVVTKACPEPIHLIQVYALRTIIFDVDFVQPGKQVQLAIVAPLWNVIGSRLINLNGLPGKDHVPDKAERGYYPNVTGIKGKPGLPGDTAGSFLGIVGTIDNGVYLSIMANGGQGGSGQNGGDGGRGRDGSKQYIEDPQQYLIDKGIYYDSKHYECNVLGCTYDPVVTGACTNGGEGGDPGAGGFGGKPGIIDLQIISNSTYVTIIRSDGLKGKSGLKGKPGAGGRGGKSADITWVWIRFWDTTQSSYSDISDCTAGSESWFPSINKNNIELAKAPIEIDRTGVLKDYLKFVKEEGSIIKRRTYEFLKKIPEMSTEVNDIINPTIDEGQNLSTKKTITTDLISSTNYEEVSIQSSTDITNSGDETTSSIDIINSVSFSASDDFTDTSTSSREYENIFNFIDDIK